MQLRAGHAQAGLSYGAEPLLPLTCRVFGVYAGGAESQPSQARPQALCWLPLLQGAA